MQGIKFYILIHLQKQIWVTPSPYELLMLREWTI